MIPILLSKAKNTLLFEIDNTGNIEDLVNDQVEFTLSKIDYNISSINSNASNIAFELMDGTNIIFYLLYKNADNAYFYLKINQNKLTKQRFTVLSKNSQGSSYINVMTRKITATSSALLYKCNNLSDSNNQGVDIVNYGCILESTVYGDVIALTNSYFTISEFQSELSDNCGFGFNFIVTVPQINVTIFEKRWWDNHVGYDANLKVSINSTGKLQIDCTMRNIVSQFVSSDNLIINNINHLYFRWTSVSFLVYYNSTIVLTLTVFKPLGGAPNTFPLTFGTDVFNLDNNFNGYIYDIEINTSPLLEKELQAWSKNINICKRYQNDKLNYITQYPQTVVPNRTWQGEATMYVKDNRFHCYFQKSPDNQGHEVSDAQLAYIYSDDNCQTWSETQILLGLGVGGENKAVFRPSVIYHDGIVYMIYLGIIPGQVQDLHLTIRSSTDNITFVDPQVFIDTSNINWPENTSIFYDTDDNKFKALIELFNNGWMCRYMEGTTLYNMAIVGDWMPSMSGSRTPKCIACPDFKKIDGKYYAFTAQQPASVRNDDIFPDIIFSCYTTTPSQDNWIANIRPTTSLDQYHQEDQTGDPFLIEHNGKTYLVCTASNNNIPHSTTAFVLHFYVYDGTLSQFVTDLTIKKI